MAHTVVVVDGAGFGLPTIFSPFTGKPVDDGADNVDPSFVYAFFSIADDFLCGRDEVEQLVRDAYELQHSDCHRLRETA